MASRVRSVVWCLAVVAVVACSRSEHATGGAGHAHEHTQSVSQELTSGQLLGTSLPAKTLALTFDDGPGDSTSALSTYLKNQDIRATFFINGARVAAPTAPLAKPFEPTANAVAILNQIVADGHLLANHTTTHRDVTTLNATNILAELTQTDAYIAPRIPANRFVFRAPFGNWNTTAWNNLKNTAMNKYVGPIYWEAGGNSNQYPNAAADWACWQGQLYAGATKANGTGYATSAQCGDAYVKEIETYGKGIVLMHDPYGWAQGNTLDMVKYMVPILKGKGYTFARIDEVPAIAALLPCDTSCATCSGPEASQCTSCAGGKFLEAGTCKTCSTCQPGQYVATACSANADTQCTACDVACATCTGAGNTSCQSCTMGNWQSGSTCLPCSACAAGEYASAACTPTTNTACAACDASCAACTGPTANECGSCGAGKYLGNGGCKACSTCAAGTYASAACAASADTTCTACAAGSWSAGNATACTACGSCDDGDACTTDACDATKGCTHTKLADCPKPDAGASSSSSSGGSSSSSGGSTSSGGTSGGVPVSDGGVPIDPGANLDPVPAGESGCATSPAPATGSEGVPALIALLGLALAKRRRRAAA